MNVSSRFALAVAAGLLVPAMTLAEEDPFAWLEEVEGERALDWAREQNAESLDYLKSHPLFEPIHERNLEIYNSEERIAYPGQMGGQIYNFWQDAEHVRGIWRRTSPEAYRQEEPEWETLIDVDRLAEAEDENWVWSGSDCRYPDYDLCLVSLSRGGADATVVREFDLREQRFVEDGFRLPEAKSAVAWRDADSVFVGTDFGAGSLTDSGYPRIVKIWKRGTPLEQAETVFEGDKSDVGTWAFRAWDGDDYYDMIQQSTSFYTRNYFVLRDGEPARLDLPEDAEFTGLLDGQVLVELKSDWKRGDTTFRQGALLATGIAPLLAGKAEFEVLFKPTERASITSVSSTDNAFLVNILDNVISRVVRFRHDAEGWHRHEMEMPSPGAVSIVSTDDKTDSYYFNYTGFLTPSSLYEADALEDTSRVIKSQPAFFDPEGMTVQQYEATSADGTKIPYFMVTPRGFEPDGENPTLLYGYGGFEISMRPSYSATAGTAWLARGGVYVVANIRGGGEFGPRWHQAALKENRQRAYDDFIAVAEDLVRRDITSPEHLGIQGGSNGGLLVGATFVQRPDLFNAVVCQVPLLDMKRYHKLLAGASWMAEYGDPDKPEEWAYIKEYSPYQNVSKDADYPKVYFFTSTRDDRVHPGHARKMVARMKAQGHDVLYYENIEGGHGGAANLNQAALNSALSYTYLHDRLVPGSRDE